MHFGNICRWLVASGLAVVLVWSSSGCSNNATGDKLLPVSGKVTYKGEPLTTGTVILVADVEKGNTTKHEPRGPIDNQGNYEVSVTAGQPGAPPGWYKIAVIAKKLPNPSNPYAITASLLPKKYESAKTSGLAFQVTENAADGAYDLVLK
jgi:hypothetical protein